MKRAIWGRTFFGTNGYKRRRLSYTNPPTKYENIEELISHANRLRGGL